MTVVRGSVPSRPMQCMEIWGGNQVVEEAVSTPGLDVWVYSRPHEQAVHGGDVYYASLCGGGVTTRIILADVCGHGADVADVAKALRGLMRKNINRKNPARLVHALNRQFTALAECKRFATAVVATYLTRGNRLTVSNAGHPRPLWYAAAKGSWSFFENVDAARGNEIENLPLGIQDGTGYTQVEITLGLGDLILFYTDALTEAEHPARGMLGEAGLLELVRGLDATEPANLPAAMVAALDDFRGGAPANDDATFVLLHHNAGPARPPGLLKTLDVYAKVLGLKSV